MARPKSCLLVGFSKDATCSMTTADGSIPVDLCHACASQCHKEKYHVYTPLPKSTVPRLNSPMLHKATPVPNADRTVDLWSVVLDTERPISLGICRDEGADPELTNSETMMTGFVVVSVISRAAHKQSTPVFNGQ